MCKTKYDLQHYSDEILLKCSYMLFGTVDLCLAGIVILKHTPVGHSGMKFGKTNGLFQMTIDINVSSSQM
jgi:hypothetical protein